MGCYGIGVNRIIASLVETSHDENGIIWPLSLAPYEVLLIPLNVKEAEVAAAADKLYDELSAAGVDVLLGRSRPAAGRQIQGCRPDRHSAARGDRRTQPGRRTAGSQMARRRRADHDSPFRRGGENRRLLAERKAADAARAPAAPAKPA